MGFEPTTACLQDRRSNQLSYGALCEVTFDDPLSNERQRIKHLKELSKT